MMDVDAALEVAGDLENHDRADHSKAAVALGHEVQRLRDQVDLARRSRDGWQATAVELRAVELRARDVCAGKVESFPNSGRRDLAADVARYILGDAS